MSIQFTCPCGRSIKVKDESAGRKVRCPSCAMVIVVPTPALSDDAENEAINELLAEGPPPLSPPKPIPEDDGRYEEEKRPRSKPRSMPPDPTREARVPRIKKPDSSYSGIAIHPQIITGVLMMVVAAIWFFGALSLGWVFWYPPIMFVLGIGAVFKGITGRDD